MIFKKTLASLLIGTALSFSGCEEPIKGGQVYDKIYHKPYSETTFTTINFGETNILIPQVENRFFQEIDGKKKTRSYMVTKEEFEKTNIGQHYGIE